MGFNSGFKGLIYEHFTVLHRTETYQIPWMFHLPKQLNLIHDLAHYFFKISFNIMQVFTSRFQSKPFNQIFLIPACIFINFCLVYDSPCIFPSSCWFPFLRFCSGILNPCYNSKTREKIPHLYKIKLTFCR